MSGRVAHSIIKTWAPYPAKLVWIRYVVVGLYGALVQIPFLTSPLPWAHTSPIHPSVHYAVATRTRCTLKFDTRAKFWYWLTDAQPSKGGCFWIWYGECPSNDYVCVCVLFSQVSLIKKSGACKDDVWIWSGFDFKQRFGCLRFRMPLQQCWVASDFVLSTLSWSFVWEARKSYFNVRRLATRNHDNSLEQCTFHLFLTFSHSNFPLVFMTYKLPVISSSKLMSWKGHLAFLEKLPSGQNSSILMVLYFMRSITEFKR